MDSLWLIGYVFLAGAAIVQALLVAINVYEHRRRALVRLKKISYYAPTGRVLVLSPCKGHDANLEENLRALLTQDYPDYEVTFIVEDAGDPACPVIRRAMAACPQTPARLLVAGQAEGCGQKVHNLRMATADLSPEIRHLAFFDSDSRPKPYWVRAAIYKHYLPQIGATTGYRWLIPQKPTVANHLVSAINCNVMAVLGRDSHHMVWGGSWAIRRETFEQLKIREAWEGMLSDDLVASNQLHRAGLEVRFDPACVLTSPVDFDWCGHVRFRAAAVPHYAALCLPLVVAGLGRGDGRQPGVDCLARAAGSARCSRERSIALAAGGRAWGALRPGVLPRLGHAEPGCRLLAGKSAGTARRAAMAHLGESRRGFRAMARADRLGLRQPCEVESDRLSAWRRWPSAFQADSRHTGRRGDETESPDVSAVGHFESNI